MNNLLIFGEFKKSLRSRSSDVKTCRTWHLSLMFPYGWQFARAPAALFTHCTADALQWAHI